VTRIVPRSELPHAKSAEEAVRLTVGTRLGRYELLCPIAEGGMAQVWGAEQTGDLGFRKLIALKTIRPDFAFDASFRAMFLDEAQLASRIRHVNVVEVLDLGVEGEIVFQAMALVDGVATSEWMRAAKGQLPIGVALRIAIDMLHGLHAAHTLKDDDGAPLGLVHRDVSPQNVLVGSDGVAKLADFGIAKAFGRAAEETIAGDVKGKLAYVAPEQLVGLPAAPQSDLYSAGVVFWELLTGQRLFPVGNSTEKRHQMRVRDPRTIVPSLPPSIGEIVMRALKDDHLARYETSLEMADALEEAARREGINATHRLVATTLEQDLGKKLEATRERIRQAKKRAGALTPTPPPTPRGARITGPMRPSDLPAFPPAHFTAPLPLPTETIPPTRVVERHDLATDIVTIGETPRPMFEPQAVPRKRSNAALIPLMLTAVLMAALIVLVTLLRAREEPAAAVATPPPIVTALPVVVAPALAPTPAPAPLAEPVAAPAPSVAPTHRPIVSHGRARPPPAPKPAPAPAPPATIGPRFENPY
jgi:serine/threonine-protein kinase